MEGVDKYETPRYEEACWNSYWIRFFAACLPSETVSRENVGVKKALNNRIGYLGMVDFSVLLSRFLGRAKNFTKDGACWEVPFMQDHDSSTGVQDWLGDLTGMLDYLQSDFNSALNAQTCMEYTSGVAAWFDKINPDVMREPTTKLLNVAPKDAEDSDFGSLDEQSDSESEDGDDKGKAAAKKRGARKKGDEGKGKSGAAAPKETDEEKQLRKQQEQEQKKQKAEQYVSTICRALTNSINVHFV